MEYPTISIVTTLYNTELWLWEKTLRAIKMQDYPKKNIEHIVMDGGSTNGADEVAEKYNCKVFRMPKLLEKAEARMGLGIKKAKGDLILLLEPDNIMCGSLWLKQMVQPFSASKDVIGTFSIYNTYEKDMPILTKYFSLIGMNDPLVFFLGKSEKLPVYKNSYTKGDVLTETANYYIVRFSKDALPTLGNNGHMFRRTVLNKVIKDPFVYLHTDECAKLQLQGFGTYGVVKNSIIHYSGSSVIDYISRRLRYKRVNFDTNRNKRIYLIYNPDSWEDRAKLALFIFFSLSIFPMIFFSIWGYVHKRDIAWFLHPVICFVAVVSYGLSELRLGMTTAYDYQK